MSESETETTLPRDQRISSKAAGEACSECESSNEVQSENSKDCAPEPTAVVTDDAWGLSATDRYFALCLGSVLLLLLVAHGWRLSSSGTESIEVRRLENRSYEFTLDVNTATWVEWMQLEGIGEKLAVRIVEDREASGPFSSIDEVTRVRGIGPKTLERIRPYLICTDCP